MKRGVTIGVAALAVLVVIGWLIHSCASSKKSFVYSGTIETREIQIGYVEEATNIVHEASGGKLPKEFIWVNVLHAIDGTWGIAGKAMTNEDLGKAVSKG